MRGNRARIPRTVKEMVLRRTDYRYWYCGDGLNVAGQLSPHIDHVLPVSKGGGNDPDNLVASCRNCNTEKGDMTLKEFRVIRGNDLFWFERKSGGWTNE